ncbi:MAG: hypothetical protein IPJ66_14455 [Bacteroidetes bacterium]|nr:hypothetical protein [Bacteroidota bacterium]
MKVRSAIVLLVFLSFQSYATRYYVNVNAFGTNNGLSWTDAFTNLQSALSVAIYNDEIWVAAGTYFTSDTNDRDISFVMKNGVNVYGSFSGIETSITQRDIALFPTFLSGDIGAPGDNSDNTKKIIKIQNIATNFILDGFKIVSGFDGSSSGEGAGAYIYNNSGGDIEIDNCVFYNNYSYYKGGAVSIDETNITFNNCEFYYNSSYNYGGGAIYSANVSNSNITLNNSKLIGNTSRSGGAIQFDGYTLKLDRCLISNNTATSGSIIQVSDANDFTISNSLIVGNLVQNNYSASVISSYSIQSNSTNLVNVTICHNRNSTSFAIADEAIYKSNSSANIFNCIIYGNSMSDVNAQVNSGNNVVNCIIENGYASGINIYNLDPLFVNPSDLASAPFDGSAFDYSLQSNSPAVNRGDNLFVTSFLFDYSGNSRIQQGVVDLGAIESSYLLSVRENNGMAVKYFFDSGSNRLYFKDIGQIRDLEITVFDINGKLLETGKISGPDLFLNYSKGIYIVKVGTVSPFKIAIAK